MATLGFVLFVFAFFFLVVFTFCLFQFVPVFSHDLSFYAGMKKVFIVLIDSLN